MANTQNEIRKEFEILTDEELKQVTGGNGEDLFLDECLQCIDRAIGIINDALPSADEMQTSIFNVMLEDLGVIKSCIYQKNYSVAKYYSDGVCDNFVLIKNKPAFLADTLDGIKSYLLNI